MHTRFLLLAAVIFALIGVFGGFTWWDWAGKYEAGWICASLGCGWGSSLNL